MSEFSRETLLNIIETDHVQCGEASALASMALAAMDSEPVEMPLDYLQGHKDGLEWAAQLAEANHPETGDWLYDDPIELAKAIRKGPDMPPAQPVEDSEPDCNERQLFCSTDTARMKKVISVSAGSEATPLYRHAQPAPVVPDDYQRLRELYHAQEKRLFKIAQRIKGPAFDKYSHSPSQAIDVLEGAIFGEDGACRAAMLAAAPQSPGSEPATVPGKWIPVSERMPEDDDFVYIWPRPDFGVELHIGQYCERNHKGGGWYAQVYEQNYGIEWHPITVTHWMPLPAGPQGVKGE
ncbi:DUF551 domain-containing protein [Klebsiella pneumoniae]|uniref:DUF551 domain-containing protein n=1 Tax=Klebsiella pneumoniae TaxID=573 RepID=UPI00338F545C